MSQSSIEINCFFLAKNIPVMLYYVKKNNFNTKCSGKSSSCRLRVIPGNGRLNVTESQLVD